MKTRKIIMQFIRDTETEVLKYGLRIDLMRKANKRFTERGETLKINIVEALIHNEQKQKAYHEGILTGYKLALTLMK